MFSLRGNSVEIFFPCARNDVSLSLRFLRVNLDLSSSRVLEQSELFGSTLSKELLWGNRRTIKL